MTEFYINQPPILGEGNCGSKSPPGHKGYDDLTSSSPSSDLSPVVCSRFQTQRWQLNMSVALVAGLNPTPYRTS
ncbi:hypothetical protein GBA52_008164 [Prunus armeniaca]|nr:hypothetical protein GBA52_008164 [Prunus armeniaca]